jgi:hypothetical protein
MDEQSQIIKPQEGYQESALSSSADILIGGGSAGAGKTFSLLLESVRHIATPGYNGVIFRRTTPQIKNPGGLWDTSRELYSVVGGDPKESINAWSFGDNKIRFAHLEYDKDVLSYQGSAIPFIGFDELTHFSKYQFFYMLSRNRSTSGIKPYVRATCNPDPDSWVADFISWWIDQETGFPIPERSGVLRYFTQDQDNYVWGDSLQEIVDKLPHIFNLPEFKDRDPSTLIKSVTFIPGSIYDNKKFLSKDPSYLGNLLALSESEQYRLLKGNWKIRQDGSSLFDYQRINDLFSNFLEKNDEKYITCDYARFGQDLTIIISWIGLIAIRIEIMTKSSTVEAFDAIEKERDRLKIPRSNVVVDDDGVGGGVVDLSKGEYISFHANATPVKNPETEDKEDYKNYKTQCYYMLADKVNKAEMRIYVDNIIVDGESTTVLKKGQSVRSIETLIKEDLRSIKKKDMDKEGKRQINSKEEQKVVLGGRSPDFADTLMMRMAIKNSKVEYAFL